MLKVFISQPMRGKSDEEILREREAAARQIREQAKDDDVEIINSFFRGVLPDAAPLWYLGESLKLLSGADVAYFAPGWESARGCKIEMQCAAAYGIPVIIGEEA